MQHVGSFLCRVGSFLAAYRFSSCGVWAPGSTYCHTHAQLPAAHGILPDQDQTHISCIARQTLNLWTTREIPDLQLLVVFRPFKLIEMVRFKVCCCMISFLFAFFFFPLRLFEYFLPLHFNLHIVFFETISLRVSFIAVV